MNKPNLDARLLSVAKFVREGAYACDIGTDHAYLPVYLVLIGRAVRALASDINKGPVERAKISVSKYGVSDKIDVILSAGLDGAADYPVTDIIIAGMGGELIASIIDAAKWTRDCKYRLILQPMTHPELLRAYLIDNGFDIKDEDIVPDKDGKIYQIICAEFGTSENDYTADELLLGHHNIRRGGEAFSLLCERTRKINLDIKTAKERAGQNASEEDAVIAITEKYLNT